MTLEEKAKKWVKENCCDWCLARSECAMGNIDCNAQQAYLGGAEENGFVWHDLRKDPNDLPKENVKVHLYARDKEYYIGFWENGAWKYESGFYASDNFVIAWCEIPQF